MASAVVSTIIIDSIQADIDFSIVLFAFFFVTLAAQPYVSPMLTHIASDVALRRCRFRWCRFRRCRFRWCRFRWCRFRRCRFRWCRFRRCRFRRLRLRRPRAWCVNNGSRDGFGVAGWWWRGRSWRSWCRSGGGWTDMNVVASCVVCKASGAAIGIGIRGEVV